MRQRGTISANDNGSNNNTTGGTTRRRRQQSLTSSSSSPRRSWDVESETSILSQQQDRIGLSSSLVEDDFSDQDNDDGEEGSFVGQQPQHGQEAKQSLLSQNMDGRGDALSASSSHSYFYTDRQSSPTIDTGFPGLDSSFPTHPLHPTLEQQMVDLRVTRTRSTSPDSPRSGGLVDDLISLSSSSMHQRRRSQQQREQQRFNQSSFLHQRMMVTHQSAPSSLQNFHVLYRNAVHVPDKDYGAYLKMRQQQQDGRPVENYQSFRNKLRDSGLGIRVTKPCCAQTCMGFSLVAVIFLVFVGVLLDTQPLFIKGSLPREVIYAGTDDDVNQQQLSSSSSYGRPMVVFQIPDSNSQRLSTATTAYRAAVAYVMCALLCYWVLYPNWIQSHIYRFRNQYQNLDLLPIATSATNAAKTRRNFFFSPSRWKQDKKTDNPMIHNGENMNKMSGVLPLYSNTSNSNNNPGSSDAHAVNNNNNNATVFEQIPQRSWWTQMSLRTRNWLAAAQVAGWTGSGKKDATLPISTTSTTASSKQQKQRTHRRRKPSGRHKAG